MTDIVEQLENTTGIHEELIYEAAKEIKRQNDITTTYCNFSLSDPF